MSSLEPEVLALLPEAHEAPRCAVHAAAIGTDPGGTAISAAGVALVEAPLPWTKPVFAGEPMSGLSSMMSLALGPTRVLATVPRVSVLTGDSRGGEIAVSLHWRFGGGTRSVHFECDGTHGLHALFGYLSEHSPGDVVPLAAGFEQTGVGRDEPAVLICTQGSHDICCGSEGTRLAADFEAVQRLAELGETVAGHSAGASVEAQVGLESATVHRVSHTGGHRFAPTAMTLPGGRMWAGIEAGELASILERTGDSAALASYCRGWWGAATGPAQVGERAVFAQVGWPLDALAREVSFRRSEEIAEAWEVEVAAAEAQRAWTATVTEGRTVPTIACRAAGGLPAKPATEFNVISVREHKEGNP